MDKNTITGLVLIVLVLVGFNYLSQPSEEELRVAREQAEAVQLAEQKAEDLEKEKEAAEALKAATAAMDTTSLLYPARMGEQKSIVLENEVIKLALTNRGGMPESVELKDYRNQEGGNVVLFNGNDAHMRLLLAGKNENIISSELFFEPVEHTDSTATMRLTMADGNSLDLCYRLRPQSYMVDFEVRANGMANFFAPTLRTLDIEWTDRARQQEKGFDFENRYSSLTYKLTGEGTDYLSETSDEQETISDPLDWIAFKNQFFSCVLIAHQDFTGPSTLRSTPQTQESGYLKLYDAQVKTFFDPTGAQPTLMQLYLGPNNYHILQETNDLSLSDKDLELEDLVYLGWPLFKWINRWFILYIFDWLSSWGLPMGIVLLLLTLFIKALVYVPTKKSFLSSARMRVLKPKVDEINAKYPKPEDAMRKQQEVMQLYAQYGVSPMGGCLPMLVQMPVWIALFNFVPNAIELRGQSFLWASDLSTYDDVISWGTNIWLIGDHLSIFCLLFCVTNIVNTWISMRQQQNTMTGEQAQQMKIMQYMMYAMPVMFFFMFNNYSSGLNYYYFLSGLTSILTMWYLRKTTDDNKLLAELEARYQANKSNPKKTSGLAARLEALQKQQQQMLEEQKKRQNKH